jgi:hypothetical protein
MQQQEQPNESRPMFETVIVNAYGDTAQQWRSSSAWKADYLAYQLARCDAHVTEWLNRGGKK